MVLENYVILRDGVPSRVHIADMYLEARTITEGATGRPAPRNTLIMVIDGLDSRVVAAKLTTMAEKFASQMMPYMANKEYLKYDFTIIQRGDGYLRSWTITKTPRA